MIPLFLLSTQDRHALCCVKVEQGSMCMCVCMYMCACVCVCARVGDELLGGQFCLRCSAFKGKEDESGDRRRWERPASCILRALRRVSLGRTTRCSECKNCRDKGAVRACAVGGGGQDGLLGEALERVGTRAVERTGEERGQQAVEILDRMLRKEESSSLGMEEMVVGGR